MGSSEAPARKTGRIAALGLGAAGALALSLLMEVRVKRPERALTDGWRDLPIEPRRSRMLGISFRPSQVDAYGLDSRATLQALLRNPFQVVRLGAYWNRVEPQAGSFEAGELDWQVDAAEAAGKKVILCVGPIKTFGYPEFFVPSHR